MSNEIKTKREITYQRKKEKTREPKWQELGRRIIKMIVQTIIFYFVFYNVYIGLIRQQYSDPVLLFLVELGSIVQWLIASDVLTFLIFFVLVVVYYYLRGFSRKDTLRQNYSKALWQYMLYLGLRALLYTIQMTNVLIIVLGLFPVPYWVRFVFAWAITSLIAIIGSHAGALYIISR